MHPTVIYTKDNCKFCVQAKALMEMRGIAFEESKIVTDEDRQNLIKLVPSAKTLPQIFVSGVYVGGFDSLNELHQNDRIFVNRKGQVIIQ